MVDTGLGPIYSLFPKSLAPVVRVLTNHTCVSNTIWTSGS